jgi:hypothetical protein
VSILRSSRRARLVATIAESDVEVSIPPVVAIRRRLGGRVVEVEIDLGEVVRAAGEAAIASRYPVEMAGGLIFARVVG